MNCEIGIKMTHVAALFDRCCSLIILLPKLAFCLYLGLSGQPHYIMYVYVYLDSVLIVGPLSLKKKIIYRVQVGFPQFFSDCVKTCLTL